MKRLSFTYLAISLCFINGCSTFDDVSFDDKAEIQLNDIAQSSIDIADAPVPIALPRLLCLDEIDVLIAQAIANNPNLQQTLLTLKMAEQRLTVTSSAQWPSVTAGLNSSKAEYGSGTYSANVNVAWTIDMWQQLADASSAEEANAAATAYAYQGAKDLLVANVMKAYLGLVQLAQLIVIESERVTAFNTNEQLIVDRYRKGLMQLNELDTAKSSTQSSRAALVAYKAQYEQALRNIILLTGVSKNKINYHLDFPAVLMPLDDMAAQNLGRRPDLQQAYQNIIASQYQHKVAYKALLPSLTLSGSVTGNDSSLHDALFGSSAWQILGQLSAPIFNAGKLTSEVEIAKLTAEKTTGVFKRHYF